MEKKQEKQLDIVGKEMRDIKSKPKRLSRIEHSMDTCPTTSE